MNTELGLISRALLAKSADPPLSSVMFPIQLTAYSLKHDIEIMLVIFNRSHAYLAYYAFLTGCCISLILQSGCSTAITTGRLAASTAASGVRENFVSSNRLSEATRQALRMAGLEEDPCLDGCHGRLQLSPDTPRTVTLYARSELALAHAARLNKSGQASPAIQMEAAQYALEGITSTECATAVNFICDDFKLFYISGVINLLTSLQRSGWNPGAGIPPSQIPINIEISWHSDETDPKKYHSITPAGLVSFKGLANRLVRYGLGIPVSACRERDPKNPSDTYLPRVGTCLPLTAVLDIPEHTGKPRLTFYNAFTTETVTVHGKVYPLAANFSAPFASLIEKTGLTAYSGFFRALSGGDELLEKTGFFTVEPYRTGKIPLLFIHGLFSSPVTWVSLQNELMGDPIIRKHYQIWSYLYPTQLPILVNAETFRDKLEELKRYLTESHQDGRESPGMVIIAHSLGGLLTKTAIVKDSEPVRQHLWESPEKLDPETRSLVDRLFNFRIRPYVERVIFVAVPFRGSDVADNWIGWLGRKLIGLPKALLQTTSNLSARIKDAARPGFSDELDEQDLTSVRGLSPRNPVLLGLANTLVDRCVPYHLIEGDRGRGGGANATDGVVKYASSHLEGAESELIVPTGHTAFAHPLAVREIKRILYQHLAQREHHREACQ